MYFPAAFAISLSIYPSLPPPFPFFPISPFNFDPARNTRIASSLAHNFLSNNLYALHRNHTYGLEEAQFFRGHTHCHELEHVF